MSAELKMAVAENYYETSEGCSTQEMPFHQVPCFGGSGSGSSSDVWQAPPSYEDLPQFGRGSSSESVEDDFKADAPVVDLNAAAARARRQEEALAALGSVSEMLKSPLDETPPLTPTSAGLKDLVLVAGLPRDAAIQSPRDAHIPKDTDGTESEDSLAISSDDGTVGTDAQDVDMSRSSPDVSTSFRKPLENGSSTGTVIYSPRTASRGAAVEDGFLVAALRERCVHLENEGFALREEVLKLREQLKTSEHEQLKTSEQLTEQARKVAATAEEAQKQPQAGRAQTQSDFLSKKLRVRGAIDAAPDLADVFLGHPQSPCRMGRAQSPSGHRGRHPSQPSQSPPPILPRVDMSEVEVKKVEQPACEKLWIDSPAPPGTPPSPAASMKLQNFVFEVPDSSFGSFMADSPDIQVAQTPISSPSGGSPCPTPRSCSFSHSRCASMKVIVSDHSEASAEAVFKFEAPFLEAHLETGEEMPSESHLLNISPKACSLEATTPKTEIIDDSDDDPDVALLGPRLPEPIEETSEAEEASEPAQAPMLTCPSGHLMIHQPPAEDRDKPIRWVCDGCEKRSDSTQDFQRYRCNHCDYDLCGSCSSDADAQHKPAFICPHGHKLQVYAAVGPVQWACQGCSKSDGWTAEMLRYKCNSCNYNVCDSCRTQQRSGQATSPSAAATAGHPGPCRNSSAGLPLTVRQSLRATALVQRPGMIAKAKSSSMSLPPGNAPKGVAMLPFGKITAVESRNSTPAKGGSPPPVALPTTLPIPARVSTGSKAKSDCLTSSMGTQSEADSVSNGHQLFRMKTTESLASDSTCASPVPRERLSRSSSPSRLRLVSANPLSGSGQAKVMVSVTASPVSSTAAPPPTARIMVEPNPNEPPVSMPATFETFEWLGNLALPIIAKGIAAAADLGRAFRFSDEANSVHIHLHGVPSGEATYNKACCFSLAASAFFEASDVVTDDVSPGLPPNWSGSQPLGLAEARLELAITMLDQAVAAGFSDTAQMVTDPDLRTVRDKRPVPFAAVIQRAKARRLAIQPAAVMSQTLLAPPAGGAAPASSASCVPHGGKALPTSAENTPVGPKVSACTPGSASRQSLGSCTAIGPTPVRNLASLAKELPTSVQPGECL